MDERELQQSNLLVDAIGKFGLYINILKDIDNSCKDFVNGTFSYEEGEFVSLGPSIIEATNEVPKTLNFGILYSIDDDSVRENLTEYRNLYNEASKYVESVEQNLEEALFNYTNYYEPTFNAVIELNAIQEFDESLGDYICEVSSNYFFNHQIVSSDINSDLLLNVLDNMDDEVINSYIYTVKAKLKEIQSLSPYSESGLEIYQKPVEKKTEAAKMNDDYEKEFKNILKNANRDVDDF